MLNKTQRFYAVQWNLCWADSPPPNKFSGWFAKGDCMKTEYQRFRVYGRNGCMGEFYSYGFDIESSRNIFALMKKEKVKILYQMPITKICNDGGSVVYENEEAQQVIQPDNAQ